jgi:hypothetical protein
MATSPRVTQSGHEKTDASPRGLIYFAGVIAIILVVVALLLILLFKHFQKAEPAGSFVATPFEAVEPTPPPPHIQPDPRADMRSYADSQEKLLNTYGWIDRQNGIVRLPIDRAMELLLQRGLPTRSGQGQENRAANEQPKQMGREAASNAAQGVGQ